MKKTVVVIVIGVLFFVLVCGGFSWYNQNKQNARLPNPFVPTPPSGLDNVQLCLDFGGTYCDELGEAQKLEVQNRQQQYILALTAQAPPPPTPTPPGYPEELGAREKTFTYFLIGMAIIAVVVALLVGLGKGLGVIYHEIRTKPQRERDKPQTAEAGDLQMVVKKADPDKFESPEIVVVADKRAKGTTMAVFVDGQAQQFRVSDPVGSALAFGDAMGTAANQKPSQQMLAQITASLGQFVDRQAAALTAGVQDAQPASTEVAPPAPAAAPTATQTVLPAQPKTRRPRRKFWQVVLGQK